MISNKNKDIKKRMTAFGLIRKPKIGNIPNEILKLNVEVPVLKDGEALVKIISSTIHPDDISIPQGTALGRFLGPSKVTYEDPFIMGSNFSGIIVAVGKNVSKFKIGDNVIGIPCKTGENGSWAEYRAMNEKSLMKKPQDISHNEAAASIIAGCVAYGMLQRATPSSGDLCVVLGASGGIGSILIQMLKIKGATVIGICSTRNVETVKALGADRIVDYTRGSYSDILSKNDMHVDYVFDSVGGKLLEKDALKVLSKSGKYITVCGPVKYIGERKLSWIETFEMFSYIFSRVVGSQLIGPRYIFSDTPPEKNIKEMFEFIISNQINVLIDQVIPMEYLELKDALRLVASHKATGRVVIENRN